MMETPEKSATEDYKASLDELNSISKIEINALTMLAEENKDIAVSIASCIEQQFKLVPDSRKLPILYLIDSICKNYPESRYVQLFTQNIVSNFCSVFKVSDEKVRRSLHKLRVTWSKTKIFPKNKLEAIDERVHAMDPNWPVLHKIPSNPPQPQPPPPPTPATTAPGTVGTKRVNNNNGGRRKRSKLQSQQNQQIQSQPIVQPSEPILVPPPPPQIFIVPNIIEPLPPPPPQFPTQTFCNSSNSTNQELQPLNLLYGGKQCSNCSLRFMDNNRYASHLDWHFRQNLKSDQMFARRKWYYPLNLWVQFREMTDDDPQDNNNNSSNVNDLLLPNNDHEVPTAPASKDDEKNICSVCHETFEKFWAEEEEEWRLKNARMYEDERVYHPLCLMDMLQARG